MGDNPSSIDGSLANEVYLRETTGAGSSLMGREEGAAHVVCAQHISKDIHLSTTTFNVVILLQHMISVFVFKSQNEETT